MQAALGALGEFTGLHRVYIVRFDHDARAGFLVAEHCAPGIASVLTRVGSGPYSYADYEEVWRPLLADQVYSSLTRLKSGANADLNHQVGTRSDLFVPIFVAGVFWGAIGFDDCVHERVYSDAEIQVLRGAAAALAAAISRDAAESARRLAEAEGHARVQRWFEITCEGAWSASIDPPVPLTLPVEEQIARIIAGGVITHSNEIGARLMGYASSADWIGRRATDFFPVNPANLSYLAAFVRGGYAIRDHESNDGAPDGRDRWFLNNLNGVVRDGALVGLYGSHRD
ncbi:MAG: GAF domain-containing protein, partial [Burkholderiales bacterium]|nr:GAF domain-containing protein [Opitutaceae bacterium]